MPELPEVETSCRGIAPHLQQQTIRKITIRQAQLRWPIPNDTNDVFQQQVISHVRRRGKYILLTTPVGTLILHLGMSGSVRVLPLDTPITKHDHVDIELNNGFCLRYNDPRRFGCLLWTHDNALQHPLLKTLGPEPLENDFTAEYLYVKTRQRKVCIKQLLMNGKIVVGVGNIYANEALFNSGIRPTKSAKRLTRQQCATLVLQVKQVLQKAITAGGTTLKDFTQADGKPGYFKQQLQVYGREAETCLHCHTPIKQITISNRSSFYCPQCQL
jgi:formamidopyrimidine-DNA glycosylase